MTYTDFTEAEYRDLLRLLKLHWRPVAFDQTGEAGPICLWRHDIDVSVQRSLGLARIEADEGVKATYFVHLHSMFYNALEALCVNAIVTIAKLGHDIGLHFDEGFYSGLSDPRDLLSKLSMEKHLLEQVLPVKVQAFSLHDPQAGMLTVNEAAGMVNAYGDAIQRRFAYVSDSNGYWRFRPLRKLLEERREERLHVLTHPEWWTVEAMSPRQRITRCIEGRSAWCHAAYDAELERSGRQNIR